MAATIYNCEECDWFGTIEDMEFLQHSDERVLPGELMAAGECPDCGSLIGIDDKDVPDHTLRACAGIMVKRGWKLYEPGKW